MNSHITFRYQSPFLSRQPQLMILTVIFACVTLISISMAHNQNGSVCLEDQHSPMLYCLISQRLFSQNWCRCYHVFFSLHLKKMVCSEACTVLSPRGFHMQHLKCAQKNLNPHKFREEEDRFLVFNYSRRWFTSFSTLWAAVQKKFITEDYITEDLALCTWL